ncbi:mediator of RNA polymerase II transcription subunit 15-like [Anopheles cruzii]|uniref:mediator of RNA polymerase II transcription subunit 15-like n=1 Tax=Anopheles cruzii TaxID=68878 RepID=UPI0022EC1863|nr:mediator of RNA polymerase II transcription subunit 15-like [Anopheles cruzii]
MLVNEAKKFSLPVQISHVSFARRNVAEFQIAHCSRDGRFTPMSMSNDPMANDETTGSSMGGTSWPYCSPDESSLIPGADDDSFPYQSQVQKAIQQLLQQKQQEKQQAQVAAAVAAAQQQLQAAQAMKHQQAQQQHQHMVQFSSAAATAAIVSHTQTTATMKDSRMMSPHEQAAVIAHAAQAAAANHHKQIEELNRAAMIQRFQAANAAAANAAAAANVRPGVQLGMVPVSLGGPVPLMSPMMRQGLALAPPGTAALLGGNMLRPGPPQMGIGPGGLITQIQTMPGMGVVFPGAPMLPMMPPRYR